MSTIIDWSKSTNRQIKETFIECRELREENKVLKNMIIELEKKNKILEDKNNKLTNKILEYNNQ